MFCNQFGLSISMVLNMGGDDVTEFLHLLLERIQFPYRDVNLTRWYDWNMMEAIKANLSTLAEVGAGYVALKPMLIMPCCRVTLATIDMTSTCIVLTGLSQSIYSEHTMKSYWLPWCVWSPRKHKSNT
jgi:hypothetical protein